MISEIFSDICCPERRGINVEILESVLYLAVEIAREGREGRKIGTLLTVGDADSVLAHSRPLILDPLFATGTPTLEAARGRYVHYLRTRLLEPRAWVAEALAAQAAVRLDPPQRKRARR